MPKKKGKDHVIRISDEIFQQIEEDARERGYGSISQYSREALKFFIDRKDDQREREFKWIENQFKGKCSQCGTGIPKGATMRLAYDERGRAIKQCLMCFLKSRKPIKDLSELDLLPCKYRTITAEGQCYCDLKKIEIEVCINRQHRHFTDEEICKPEPLKKAKHTKRPAPRSESPPVTHRQEVTVNNYGAVIPQSKKNEEELPDMVRCIKNGEKVDANMCHQICDPDMFKMCMGTRQSDPALFSKFYEDAKLRNREVEAQRRARDNHK